MSNEMTNQAAQTMPERTYMTRDEALKIARACAYAKCHTHGYLPRTAKEAADWQPHEWVLDAIRWNAILQPVRVSEAGVPEGWVLVPARMELTPENMAALAFMLGGDPDAKDADERWNGGTLWVGETVGDNGEKYYGLNVANVECYEEGSIPIVEFAAAPAASGVHPDALPDGTLSKSTAKRVEALAAAPVSERARELLAQAERGPQNDYGTVHRQIAHRAIEQALTQQRWEAVGFRARLKDGGKKWEYVDHRSPDSFELRECVIEPIYTTPQPSADAVRELVHRWRSAASENDKLYQRTKGYEHKDRSYTLDACANELESLLSGGSHA